MKVKIKKLVANAVIPSYATDGSAGMDLTATSKWIDNEGNTCYSVGLAFEIPKGYVGLLFPRSSNAKKDLLLSNAVGVLDSDYRGEVKFKFKTTYSTVNPISFLWQRYICRKKIVNVDCTPLHGNEYEVGDRIGQIIIVKYPTIEFVESEELSETTRGKGGYGSTGK